MEREKDKKVWLVGFASRIVIIAQGGAGRNGQKARERRGRRGAALYFHFLIFYFIFHFWPLDQAGHVSKAIAV